MGKIAIIGGGVSGLMSARSILFPNLSISEHPNNIESTSMNQSQTSTNCQSDLIHHQVWILEASDRVGGRIRTDLLFLNRTCALSCSNTKITKGTKLALNLGAEILHGDTTLAYKLAMREQWNVKPHFIIAQGDGGPDEDTTEDGYYGAYWLRKRQERNDNKSEKDLIKEDFDDFEMIHYDSIKDEDLIQLNESFRNLEDNGFLFDDEIIHNNENNNGSWNGDVNKSIGDYLRRLNTPSRMWSMASAGYGNTAGCTDLDQISYIATKAHERYWAEHDGDGDGTLPNHVGMGGIVDAIMKDLSAADDALHLKLNWIVEKIDYKSSNEGVLITAKDGRIIKVDAVIVTVPTSVINDGDITFIPSLPRSKIKAFSKMKMDRAIKLFLKFDKPLWPEKLQSVICADSPIPELWFRHYRVNEKPNDDSELSFVYIATCYLMSTFADSLVTQSNHLSTSATKIALRQISQMFSTPLATVEACFVESTWYDWKTDSPYIKGGYSYTNVGFHHTDIHAMAEPVEQKIFFAGEATHTAGKTVHAAMETGIRAGMEVLEQLQNHYNTGE